MYFFLLTPKARKFEFYYIAKLMTTQSPDARPDQHYSQLIQPCIHPFHLCSGIFVIFSIISFCLFLAFLGLSGFSISLTVYSSLLSFIIVQVFPSSLSISVQSLRSSKLFPSFLAFFCLSFSLLCSSASLCSLSLKYLSQYLGSSHCDSSVYTTL